ncbi:Disease resistance protein RPS5 [Cardamine amara subsp. amara]|uniref:Disease resistance protein RPS5 n=1 Tax=Cardamine amara subsp. amara TaxID=228776 RepID=A0ABD1C323_CARAN
MGNCIALNISCDHVLNRVCGCFCGKANYIYNLKENLADLKKIMEDLKAIRDDVLTRVEIEEDKGLQRLQQVQLWLSRVNVIENDFNDLTSTSIVELERLCLGGVCSMNLKKSYTYGQRVFLLSREVNNLKSDGVFEVVAKPFNRVMVEERPLPRTLVAREVIMDSAWNKLMNAGTCIMGMYGMGGVGKTALLAQINNKLSKERQIFDFAIWIDVSRDVQIEKIQEDIGEKLAFCGDEWNCKTKRQQAHEMHTFLRRKKFVLLLDDVWEKVDLTDIGVPFPTMENGCKVVFTTRSREVCGKMGVDDPMEVHCLEENDAWDLFRRKVGEKTLLSHPDIPKLARKIAEKCHGLPLALNVIGETMSCKTSLHEWKHAIDVLTSYAREFSGMEEYILPVLKYSYDSLKGEHVKSCFQYCALFPNDHKIDKEALIEYWICEGFVDGKYGRERALNQGYEILGMLVRACLLMEDVVTKSRVKMHDVVREMAMWIASDLGNHKEKCIVQAGAKVHDVPQAKDWNSVSSMSLMRTNIEQISSNPDCPQLTTLLLQTNYKLVNILGEFFMSMPMLVVLDLSMNYRLNGLPEEIADLHSLRFLDLSDTSIDRLPVGMQELKKLLHLNLESMWRLQSISGISNLSSLRLLKLRNSKVVVDNSLIEELKLLRYLETLTMNISSCLVLVNLFCAQKLVKCIQKLSIDKFWKESLSFPSMDSLNNLTIRRCNLLEIKIENCSSWNKNPCFSNLSYVWIRECSGLRDLTWLVFAPNLIDLNVGSTSKIKYIISEEKVDQEQASIIPFQKLKYLSLINLPALKSIYWSPLRFPSLKRIKVQGCLKLRKLPLDSNSGVVGEELVINYGEAEWIESVKWEDEATRLRFLSSSYTFQKEMPELARSAEPL